MLLGVKAVLDDVKVFVDIIMTSEDNQDAKDRLKRIFHLSDEQADHVLGMKFSSLVKRNVKSVESKMKKLKSEIESISLRMTDGGMLNYLLARAQESKEMVIKLGVDRSKPVANFEEVAKTKKKVKLKVSKPCTVLVTSEGYIKVNDGNSSRIKNSSSDPVVTEFRCMTDDIVMFITSNGKYYTEEAGSLPGDRSPIDSHFKCEHDETVLALVDFRKIKNFLNGFAHPRTCGFAKIVMSNITGVKREIVLGSDSQNASYGSVTTKKLFATAKSGKLLCKPIGGVKWHRTNIYPEQII